MGPSPKTMRPFGGRYIGGPVVRDSWIVMLAVDCFSEGRPFATA